MDFRILGPVEAGDADRPVVLDSARQRALLGLLLLHPNEVVSSARIVDELWGERPPQTAEKMVQIAVSQLRKALGAARIETVPPGYRVRVDADELDAPEFARLADEGRRLADLDEHAPAAEAFRRALGLWRGRALEDVVFESLAQREVERLNEERVGVEIDRIECDLALGRHAALVPELRTLVQSFPYWERLHAQLMLALYRSGRQAEALAAFQEARRLLGDEMGLDPGLDLQALQRAILQQEPALAAPPRARRPRSASNLPAPPTPFIGREDDLAAAGALLRAHRLVTLTGAGGSGKTRLARELAERTADEHSGGVFWVALQAVRDPELVRPAVARALGTDEATLERGLDRDLLLVLDNLEQVLEAASQLGNLLARSPGLTLLVTSREPLHLAGEQQYPVAPLHEAEAVALFSERARAARPDYVQDATALEICRRLDCLPLAIELAAARVKALSGEELLRRLDRTLPLLTGGPRDAPERQRTLRATIEWSHELLTPDERRVFARLAIFAGGCSLEAAEEVCEAELDTLVALVDKSLLRREADRYSLLETIREFALERLEERAELDELRRRHAEHYLGVARSVEGLVRSPRAAATLDRLERDHENLRQALASVSDGEPDAALRLGVWGLASRLHSFGDAALERADLVEAERFYRESFELASQLGDDLQTAYCLGGLAAVAARRGDAGGAARLWGAMEALEQSAGAPLHATERGRYARIVGDPESVPETAPELAAGRSMGAADVVDSVVTPD